MPEGVESRSSSFAAPGARPRQAQLLWSLAVAGMVRDLSLARETGWTFLRDDNNWLYLLDREGNRQAQLRAPRELTTTACADDGSALVAGGKDGDVWSLAPDLMPRWHYPLGQRLEAVAADPLGHYVAAADAGGGLSLLTRKGRLVWKVQTPRPLRFLAFVPEAPFLLGCADYGLVACFDVKGTMVWRDGLVAHVGALAASGDGSTIALACFTDGLYRYSLKGPPPARQPLSGDNPCRLVALSYDGHSVLTTGLSSGVLLLDERGRVRGEHNLDAPASALALAALADRAVVGTSDGHVLCLHWR
jgi:outer membrane protein assembly factor BamB